MFGLPLAASGSLLSTLGYATLSGVWGLLIARLWGSSFAAMNIATQALATAEPTDAARRSGRMRAIIAAGPVSGLIVGAVFPVRRAAGGIFVLSCAALLAFPFAARLPRSGEGRPERLQRPRFGLPSRLDTWSFIQGMTLDGLFVLGISLLAAAPFPNTRDSLRDWRWRCGISPKSYSGRPAVPWPNATGPVACCCRSPQRQGLP